MDKKLIAIIISAVIIGGGVVVYSKTNTFLHKAKHVVENIKEQAENQVENGEEHSNAQEHGKNLLNLDLSRVKNPKDLLSEATKEGPFTCYVHYYDKTTGEKGNITFSSDGNEAYIYSDNESGHEKTRMWMFKDKVLIESTDSNGKTQRIKITGAGVDSYAQMMGASYTTAWSAVQATQHSKDQGYDMKCYRKKDIPNVDESQFKDFSINFGINSNGTSNGNMQIPGMK